MFSVVNYKVQLVLPSLLYSVVFIHLKKELKYFPFYSPACVTLAYVYEKKKHCMHYGMCSIVLYVYMCVCIPCCVCVTVMYDPKYLYQAGR